MERLKCWKKIAFFNDTDCQHDDGKKKTVEVEHSCIDFTILIIGQKIRGVLEENKWNLQFNDYALAQILYIEDDEFIEFYNLEVVRKLVDY